MEAGVPRIGVLGGDGLWSVAEVLRKAGVEVVDLEPAPKQVAPQVAARWHYGRASVRAGLLGTPRAALQLLREAQGQSVEGWIWTGRDGLALDGLRPGIDPEGMAPELIAPYRAAHLRAVAQLAGAVDRLILPICSDRALADTRGRLFGAAPEGARLPEDLALSEISFTVAEMRDDLQALRDLLRSVSVQVCVLPSLGGPVALRGDDPVFDALLERVAQGGSGGALLAHLARGGDLDAYGPQVAEAEAAPKDRERRKRRKDKSRGEGARVVCEDELLEAFSK